MNREIKFRTWDTEYKEFRYLELTGMMLVSEELITKKTNVNNEAYSSLDNLKDWQQYTGLKDKNGQEIYEGDIVKTRYKPMEVKYFNDITWDSGGSYHPGFYFEEGFDCCDLDHSLGFDNDEIEIIGNIYENKELLEGNK